MNIMIHINRSYLKHLIAFLILSLSGSFVELNAADTLQYVTQFKTSGSFALIENAQSSPILVSTADHPGVLHASKNLQKDFLALSGNESKIISEKGKEKRLIIIGSIDKSPLIKELIERKKIDVNDLVGKWETFKIITVKNPLRGVKEGLVIVGSDKRGTIFGIYDLARQMGVSPWYWWADVPIPHKENLFVSSGIHTQGTPKVKYRGIFINDEAPALSGWVNEHYGDATFGHEFYEQVFELILRLKGNYLWPAMWGRAFYDDDSLNAPLAEEMGVVIGTTHHEPLHRAHVEWDRYGKGDWNYSTNPEILREFWRTSMTERGKYENIISLGMRGDGDEPMSRETATALLEEIVADQRKIIEETSGKPASESPQLWALYKEVQDYYDKGMRVPDDVTLLLCDDNWGNIRKLPNLGEAPRSGGYGIYYHFDYVGGPRNYKWLNTSPLPRIWEQMHLAYEYDVKEIWIVNVGDIKPMETPISFFLDYAWDPDRWNQDEMDEYLVALSSENFGQENAKEIADIIAKYAKYNARRKPELLSPNTYSILNYKEAERIQDEFQDLLIRAKKLQKIIPEEQQDAFYQLVLHPVEACSNLNDLYIAAAYNQLYYNQGRSATTDKAFEVQRLYEKDQAISDYYNNELSNGKWKHFMDQTHIGYTYWQQPRFNNMPAIKLHTPMNGSSAKVALEGFQKVWDSGHTETLKISDGETKFIELFNSGTEAFEYSISDHYAWLNIEDISGEITSLKRIILQIDWNKAPHNFKGEISINLDDKIVIIPIQIESLPELSSNFKGFVESNGYISIFAENFAKAVSDEQISWQILPDIGREHGGVTTFPVDVMPSEINDNSPHLTYDFYLKEGGEIDIQIQMAPTVSFNQSVGLSMGMSIDDEEPIIFNINGVETTREWEKTVAENLRIISSKFQMEKGEHTLKLWRIDTGIVYRKIIIDCGGLKESYLGPPQSRFVE